MRTEPIPQPRPQTLEQQLPEGSRVLQPSELFIADISNIGYSPETDSMPENTKAIIRFGTEDNFAEMFVVASPNKNGDPADHYLVTYPDTYTDPAARKKLHDPVIIKLDRAVAIGHNSEHVRYEDKPLLGALPTTVSFDHAVVAVKDGGVLVVDNKSPDKGETTVIDPNYEEARRPRRPRPDGPPPRMAAVALDIPISDGSDKEVTGSNLPRRPRDDPPSREAAVELNIPVTDDDDLPAFLRQPEPDPDPSSSGNMAADGTYDASKNFYEQHPLDDIDPNTDWGRRKIDKIRRSNISFSDYEDRNDEDMVWFEFTDPDGEGDEIITSAKDLRDLGIYDEIMPQILKRFDEANE